MSFSALVGMWPLSVSYIVSRLSKQIDTHDRPQTGLNWIWSGFLDPLHCDRQGALQVSGWEKIVWNKDIFPTGRHSMLLIEVVIVTFEGSKQFKHWHFIPDMVPQSWQYNNPDSLEEENHPVTFVSYEAISTLRRKRHCMNWHWIKFQLFWSHERLCWEAYLAELSRFPPILVWSSIRQNYQRHFVRGWISGLESFVPKHDRFATCIPLWSFWNLSNMTICSKNPPSYECKSLHEELFHTERTLCPIFTQLRMS